MTRAIMWFRRDLRLTDNSAVLAALAEHSDVIPVFVVDPHLMLTLASVEVNERPFG